MDRLFQTKEILVHELSNQAVVFPAPGQVEVQEFVLPPPGDEDSLARATPRSNPYVERDEAVEERASTATVGEQPSSL